MSNEYPTSSCSKTQKDENIKLCPPDDHNVELYIDNEKAEIERLETEESKKAADKDENLSEVPVIEDDERIAKIEFHCSSCGMHEIVHYFGTQPPFVFGIKFAEPTYVIRDPFQAPPPRYKPKAEYFVALGAHCHKCDKIVCKDSECSFFYINSYCLECARNFASTLPSDIQQKLMKQLATI